MTQEPVRLQRAVTYRIGSARPGTLRLWTIQPPAVWDQLQRHHSLFVDLSWIDEEDQYLLDHVEEYDWMRDQMARRIPGYGGHYPWWAHFRPKPDLRRRAWMMSPRGARYVRLELTIEPERCLLSNLDAWWGRTCNDLCLETFEGEFEEWHTELKRHGLCWWDRDLPEPWNSRRASSWERIFEVELLSRTGLFEDEIQATFERLDLADVVAVTEFTARERPDRVDPPLP